MNAHALKAKMVLLNVTTDELCTELGISRSAFYRKISGKSEFTRDEIQKIIEVLSMSTKETLDIFFGQEVS